MIAIATKIDGERHLEALDLFLLKYCIISNRNYLFSLLIDF